VVEREDKPALFRIYSDRLRGWTIGVTFPAGAIIRLFAPIPAVGPPIHCVPLAFFIGQSRQNFKLTTHFHLVQRVRILGAIFTLPNVHGEVPDFKHMDNFL
jgi:hypothetical protein